MVDADCEDFDSGGEESVLDTEDTVSNAVNDLGLNSLEIFGLRRLYLDLIPDVFEPCNNFFLDKLFDISDFVSNYVAHCKQAVFEEL